MRHIKMSVFEVGTLNILWKVFWKIKKENFDRYCVFDISAKYSQAKFKTINVFCEGLGNFRISQIDIKFTMKMQIPILIF